MGLFVLEFCIGECKKQIIGFTGWETPPLQILINFGELKLTSLKPLAPGEVARLLPRRRGEFNIWDGRKSKIKREINAPKTCNPTENKKKAKKQSRFLAFILPNNC